MLTVYHTWGISMRLAMQAKAQTAIRARGREPNQPDNYMYVLASRLIEIAHSAG
jgi:hypothetical protein